MAELLPNARKIDVTQQDKLDLVVRWSVVACFVGILVLVYTKNVNWDEFYFLSHVHAFLDGRLDRPLQTFFVRGFTWLADVPGHEMEQVFVARLAMVVLLGITATALHRIASALTDTTSANIAVLAFLTSGYVLPHGASFRADPIAAAALTSAVAFILTSQMRVWQLLIVAGLSALAFLVTIKSALYAPVYLAALIWRRQDMGVILRTLFAGALALLLIAVLYTWHVSGIISAAGKETTTNIRDAATTGLLQAGLFPRASTISTWVLLSIPQLALALLGLRVQRRGTQAILLILLMAPLLSVVIYRNAFAYFFPFASVLMMVAVAFGAQALARSPWLKWLVVTLLLGGIFQFSLTLRETKTVQQATIAEVHRLFPAPVAYIDDSNLIASFPSVGPFLSTWGLQNYANAGRPIFGDLIARHQPPLLVANKWVLTLAMNNADSTHMLAADIEALRDSYVHYNGAIWLAGRETTLAQRQQQLAFAIAGRYRLETDVRVFIDGQPYDDGDVVVIGSQVNLQGPIGTRVKLIWDTGIPPLQTVLPKHGIYSDFWSLRL